MKLNFVWFYLLCFVSLAPANEATPNAQLILEGARYSATLTKLEQGLTGNIQKNGKKTPITLFLKGNDIQFQFAENGKDWRAFHMRLNNESYDLFELIDGKTIRFPESKITETIANSDLTYEDLALRFFYWQKPQYDGSEKINGQLCHKLRLNKPSGQSGLYETVYLWVHASYGAFMQIRGYDKSGGLVKEFQVRDVMQVGHLWTLKRMQVSTHNPKDNNRRIGITEVAFSSPKTISTPKGLR